MADWGTHSPNRLHPCLTLTIGASSLILGPFVFKKLYLCFAPFLIVLTCFISCSRNGVLHCLLPLFVSPPFYPTLERMKSRAWSPGCVWGSGFSIRPHWWGLCMYPGPNHTLCLAAFSGCPNLWLSMLHSSNCSPGNFQPSATILCTYCLLPT